MSNECLCRVCSCMFYTDEFECFQCPTCESNSISIVKREDDGFVKQQQIEDRKNSQKNKKEYKELDVIEEFLISKNIRVWREEIPDQCVGWKHPYSIDMIFYLPDYGYIGVEGKDLSTHGQGSKYAEAYLQIRDKYSNKTFFNGKKIKRWCVFGKINNSDNYEERRLDCFIQHLFNKLGISYLTYKEYSDFNRLIIDPMSKHSIKIDDDIKINGDIEWLIY